MNWQRALPAPLSRKKYIGLSSPLAPPVERLCRLAMAASQYRAKGLSRQFEESVSVRGDVGPGGSATALRGTDVLRVGGARILETGFTAAGRPPPLQERPEDEAPRHPRQGAMFPEHNNDALMVNLARVDPRTVRRACCVTPCARVALQFPDWLTGPVWSAPFKNFDTIWLDSCHT